jgi:MoaA/NifB/PqqE/SkfB family radical SAM enzyme
MEINNTIWAEVDELGRLVLPAEITNNFGVAPGIRLRIDNSGNTFRFHRPVTHLAKIYIEPTNHCNLDCVICIRQSWDEPMGQMKDATFERILEGVSITSPIPAVFFGCLGEPLSHPKIMEWVAQAKNTGAHVELITNGILLTEKRARQLIDGGLDVLWVSIDGASSESYSDMRLGAELNKVIENVTSFSHMRTYAFKPLPEIGVAFVAMKRNLHELPAVIQLGRQMGARLFSVSNVMPYTKDLQAERLFDNLRNLTYLSSPWLPQLNLPKMEINEATQQALFTTLNSGCNVTLAGASLGGANDVCNFIESGSLSIGWNGDVSPCWALMHNHKSFLHNKSRTNKKHVVGNIIQKDLQDIWIDEDYVAYRERVQSFGFAPCTYCGGCEMSETNEEDCIGNSFPACGGCLWAQGVIHCP